MIAEIITKPEASWAGCSVVKDLQAKSVPGHQHKLPRAKMQAESSDGCHIEPIPSVRQCEGANPCFLSFLLVPYSFKKLLFQPGIYPGTQLALLQACQRFFSGFVSQYPGEGSKWLRRKGSPSEDVALCSGEQREGDALGGKDRCSIS